MKAKVLKPLLLSAAAILLVVATVLATMAYMTSSSAVSNVFTVGNVNIQMFETKVKNDGTPDEIVPAGGMKSADTNSYHLLPGKSYLKDPTVYVDANCDPSYLFVRVRNDLKSIERQGDPKYPTIVEQLRKNGWQEIERAASNVDAVFVYVGEEVIVDGEGKLTEEKNAKLVGGTGARQDYDVFNRFTLATEVPGLSAFGGARVAIVAYAIQADLTDIQGDMGSPEAYKAAWQYIKAELPFVV